MRDPEAQATRGHGGRRPAPQEGRWLVAGAERPGERATAWSILARLASPTRLAAGRGRRYSVLVVERVNAWGGAGRHRRCLWLRCCSARCRACVGRPAPRCTRAQCVGPLSSGAYASLLLLEDVDLSRSTCSAAFDAEDGKRRPPSSSPTPQSMRGRAAARCFCPRCPRRAGATLCTARRDVRRRRAGVRHRRAPLRRHARRLPPSMRRHRPSMCGAVAGGVQALLRSWAAHAHVDVNEMCGCRLHVLALLGYRLVREEALPTGGTRWRTRCGRGRDGARV